MTTTGIQIPADATSDPDLKEGCNNAKIRTISQQSSAGECHPHWQ